MGRKQPCLMFKWEKRVWGIDSNPTWASQVALLVKNLPANAGYARDVGSIPGSGRFPGGGNGNPLQYSCLENSLYRGAWWATVLGVAKGQTQLSNWAHCVYTYNCSCTRYFLHWIASAPLSKITGLFCVYLLFGSLFFLLIYVSIPPPKQFDD